MKKINLMLHCGANAVNREDLAKVPTPAATKTWSPIPHAALVNAVEKALGGSKMKIISEAHGLSKDGTRYFGTLQVSRPGHDQGDYGYVLGVRNSHSKLFPAGLAVGSGVFVCDNLSFSGEETAFRRHTPNIERDLPGICSGLIGRLVSKWDNQHQRFDAYKAHDLSDEKVSDLIIRALDIRAINVTQIPAIVKEWRTPRHVEFSDRNAWRFFNAVTECSKEVGVWQLSSRTLALHGLLDQEVGFVTKKEDAIALPA